MARRYEHGSTWAVWRWTDVDWLGETYLLRLHLLKTPWFAVMLHWIKGPDPHPDPHDHPVSFISLTLRGRYVERFYRLIGDSVAQTGERSRRFRLTRAEQIHRIVSVDPGTLTLVLSGPVVRWWGYYTAEVWVDWKLYRDRYARTAEEN